MVRTKIIRKTWVLIAVFSLFFSSFGSAIAAAGSDIKGHWAEDEINAWVAQGFMNGFADGTFKPNQNITRAEFMAFVNRAFGFTERANINFSDIPANSNAWYVKDVATAVAVGYIEGFQDGTIRPNDPITRQEAAAIVTRVLKLNAVANNELLSQFDDVSSFAAWSQGAISAVVEKGYMKGTPDKSFKPSKNITRAEAVVTLDRALNDKYVVYGKAGVFGPETGSLTIDGNVMISVADVTLRNMVIKGDLLLGVGIGKGDVTLNGVTVQGKTTVQGGGENSIHVINSELFTVIVDRQNGTVRIVASGSTSIADVTLQSGAKLEESNVTGDGFNNVSVRVIDDGQVVLSGDFQNVQIEVPNISVSVASGSVAQLNVNESAQNASIQILEGAKVAELTLNAESSIGGTGVIGKAVVNAEGAKIEQKPQEVVVAKGVSADVGGQKVTESTTPTQPATPPAATTPPPSTGDGGYYPPTEPDPSSSDGGTKVFTLTSTAFKNGKPIPLEYSAYNNNTSIPLSWENAPAGTKSFVLVMYDEHADDMIHWLAVNIPGDKKSIPKGVSGSGDMPGEELFNHKFIPEKSYYGPQPPVIDNSDYGLFGKHRYHFELYALKDILDPNDKIITTADGPDYSLDQLREDLGNKVIDRATLTGTYHAVPAEELTSQDEDGNEIDFAEVLSVANIDISSDPGVTESVYVLDFNLDISDYDYSLTVAILPYKYEGVPHKGEKVKFGLGVELYNEYYLDYDDESTWILLDPNYLLEGSNATLVIFVLDEEGIAFYYKIFIKDIKMLGPS